MRDIPAGLTRQQLRKEIRHERRIALAGEGFYYHDLLRWKTAEVAMNPEVFNEKGQRVDNQEV